MTTPQHWAIEDWWADPVKEVFRDALSQLGGDAEPLVSGPGHIAWADGNFSDEDIRFCLDGCATRRDEWESRFGPEALRIARMALERLLAIPEVVRNCDPCDVE